MPENGAKSLVVTEMPISANNSTAANLEGCSLLQRTPSMSNSTADTFPCPSISPSKSRVEHLAIPAPIGLREGGKMSVDLLVALLLKRLWRMREMVWWFWKKFRWIGKCEGERESSRSIYSVCCRWCRYSLVMRREVHSVVMVGYVISDNWLRTWTRGSTVLSKFFFYLKQWQCSIYKEKEYRNKTEKQKMNKIWQCSFFVLLFLWCQIKFGSLSSSSRAQQAEPEHEAQTRWVR